LGWNDKFNYLAAETVHEKDYEVNNLISLVGKEGEKKPPTIIDSSILKINV
jgi:hypothetical protein